MTILDDISPEHVKRDPFPHLVIPNALPGDYYQQLAQAFPGVCAMKQVLKDACEIEANNKTLKRSLRHLKRSNRRVNLPSKHLIDNPHVAQVWREFIDAHSRPEFVNQLLRVFSDAIAEHYPGLPLEQMVIARRGSQSKADIWADALTAVNTPFWRTGEITGPHTDHPNKLFIGLYYFKEPEDTAGGNLVLYRRLEPVTDENLKWPKPDTVQEVAKVQYQANSLVIMLNTPNAVHGVTPRKRTSFTRRFVNLIVESNQLANYSAFK